MDSRTISEGEREQRFRQKKGNMECILKGRDGYEAGCSVRVECFSNKLVILKE